MKKFPFIIFVFFTLIIQAISVCRANSIPLGLVDNHLNLVISASDDAKTVNFYGEVLGLKRISDIELPEKRKMIRYIAGESELKFIIRDKDSSESLARKVLKLEHSFFPKIIEKTLINGE